jgi:hypothetical protein
MHFNSYPHENIEAYHGFTSLTILDLAPVVNITLAILEYIHQVQIVLFTLVP